jgi:hypothetical protein
MSGALNRRLTALEEIAEEVRTRPIRTLAHERGIPFERLKQLYEECHERTVQMRAQGLTQEQIVEATAERMGISPVALQARCDELAERFDLNP